MKSQDIVVLLKLVSLEGKEQGKASPSLRDHSWMDWEPELEKDELDDLMDEYPWLYDSQDLREPYTLRALERSTGISRTQLSRSLNRTESIGLTRRDRKTGVPRANKPALYGLLVHGVRYVFPTKPGAVTRGIATSLLAPEFRGVLRTQSELVPVWPDPRGRTRGQAVEPLSKSVPHAVKRDSELYALLALVDALRIGHSREFNLARKMLAERMEVQA